MTLAKIEDLYPNYKNDIFGGEDLKKFAVYDYTNDKIGSVYDIIVDGETGRFRYLVIDTGFWIFGKKVLLPVGRASVDYAQEKVYAKGLTKEQADNLPEYDDDMTIDYDYEEKVRTVYRGVEYDSNDTVYLNEKETTGYDSGAYNSETYTEESYNYDRDSSLYDYQEANGRQSLKLYEERLIANKERFHTGTVSVGKKVATETATVSVPVEKETVVIERVTPTEITSVAPGEATFENEEVARIEVYEESADIEKQAFVREEVSVRKEVNREIVSGKETIRREELELNTDNEAVIHSN